jgi:hypothetical protein
MKLKKQTFEHKYTYEAYYYKASFPIVLAYAITGHKLQAGLSVGRAARPICPIDLRAHLIRVKRALTDRPW